MMVSNSEQLRQLFLYLGFGGVLGVFGAAVRAWRHLTASRPWQIFLQDTLFCILATGALFLFSLPLSGGLFRVAFLFTVAVGYACVRPLADRIFHLITSTIRLIFDIVIITARPPLRFVKKTAKKVTIFSKKHLHCNRPVLYNHKE
ncbi:MAG: spore cortex biosynthesis protein YabQ [Clostridia bacterium]|nr:spore cortex biosynthesis protein YabQ [Clostridia bacterium]